MNSKELQIIEFLWNFDVLFVQWSLNSEDLKERLGSSGDFSAMLMSILPKLLLNKSCVSYLWLGHIIFVPFAG